MLLQQSEHEISHLFKDRAVVMFDKKFPSYYSTLRYNLINNSDHYLSFVSNLIYINIQPNTKLKSYFGIRPGENNVQSTLYYRMINSVNCDSSSNYCTSLYFGFYLDFIV